MSQISLYELNITSRYFGLSKCLTIVDSRIIFDKFLSCILSIDSWLG